MFRILKLMDQTAGQPGQGGAAPSGGAPALPEPEPARWDDGTIEIPDLHFDEEAGAFVDGEEAEATKPAAPGGEGEGGGEAEPKKLFAILPGGAKVELDKDGNIPKEALEKALGDRYVPQDVFHREIQKARRFRGRQGAGEDDGDRRGGPAPKKEPEPFKRAENTVDFQEDPQGWYKFEREQDRLERDHERKLERQQFEDVLQTVERTNYERELDRVYQRFDGEFTAALQKVGAPKPDTPEEKALLGAIRDLVQHNPRHEYNPQEDEDGNDLGFDTADTETLVAEVWKAINDWHNFKLKSTEKRADDADREVTTTSPHRGGTGSMAARKGPAPGGSAAQGGKFNLSERKPGEPILKAILRDARENFVNK